MSTTANAPIIIKRKKVIAEAGHHGGAWKVAYADFVTAMMAFFMLMWLLNATTEQQRKGISDYFSPTIPVARVSGGGDGAMGGNNPTPDEELEFQGQGSAAFRFGQPVGFKAKSATDVAALNDVQDALLGTGGESLLSDNLLRHVISRVTDEGLVIELFDVAGAPLFTPGTDQPTETAKALAEALTASFVAVGNGVAIAAHVRSSPIIATEDMSWPLTMQRSDRFRRMMTGQGLEPARVMRTTGHADHQLATREPLSHRNNRIVVTLLRQDI